MQYYQFGTGAYPIGRTGETDAGGDVELGVGSAIIAVGAFVNELHHQGIGPELSIVRMTTKR